MHADNPVVKVSKLARIAARHGIGELADGLYHRSNGAIDIVKPRRIYGLLNERCNLKCMGCHYWRMSSYNEEMSTQQWLDALDNVRAFVGTFHINFSGGEPLLRKDVFQILNHCRDSGVYAGLTTNGAILRTRAVQRIVDARLFTLNISIDGASAATHDAQRGVRGSFHRAVGAVRAVQKVAHACGVKLPIVLKPTVSSLNIGEMPALVQLAEDLGCTVLFQPISDWGTPETSQLWVKDAGLVSAVSEELITLIQGGSPILNSEEQIRGWESHFAGTRLVEGCSVALDTLVIGSNGTLYTCDRWESIGDIKRASLGSIWRSEKVQAHRKLASRCNRSCSENCAVTRPLSQRISGAIKLIG